MHKPFTLDDMRHVAVTAWGNSMNAVVDNWIEFNAAYFNGALRPIPIVITNTQPFGKLLAFCSYGNFGRTITLNIPRAHTCLVADNNSLLHEMVHQFLFERGEDPAHSGAPWRREIMRITKLITGVDIWAGKSTVRRIDGRGKRMNKPHPDTGQASLTQAIIARWPRDGLGIDLGRLGV